MTKTARCIAIVAALINEGSGRQQQIACSKQRKRPHQPAQGFLTPQH